MQDVSLETNTLLSAQRTYLDFQEQNNLLVSPRVKIPVINSVYKTSGHISQREQCYIFPVIFVMTA